MKTKWTVKLVSAVMAVGMISSCSVALNWDNIDKATTEVTEMTAEQLPVPDIGAVVASLPGNDLKNLPPEYFMLDESSMKIEKDISVAVKSCNSKLPRYRQDYSNNNGGDNDEDKSNLVDGENDNGGGSDNGAGNGTGAGNLIDGENDNGGNANGGDSGNGNGDPYADGGYGGGYGYGYGENEKDPLVAVDKIINIGEKLFGIVEKNKPVVNVKVRYANAVPQGITHWTQLAKWSAPKTEVYTVTYKSLYGIEVVKIKYMVSMTYGGSYNGKGKYLTGVIVEPLSINTAWGYKVSVMAEVPDSTVNNAGTDANPIAAMQLKLKWVVKTAIQEKDGYAIYYMRGDGRMKEIGSAFEK